MNLKEATGFDEDLSFSALVSLPEDEKWEIEKNLRKLNKCHLSNENHLLLATPMHQLSVTQPPSSICTWKRSPFICLSPCLSTHALFGPSFSIPCSLLNPHLLGIMFFLWNALIYPFFIFGVFKLLQSMLIILNLGKS